LISAVDQIRGVGCLIVSFSTFAASQIFPAFHPWVGLLPRCQLVICCGAGVPLSYIIEWRVYSSLALTDAH